MSAEDTRATSPMETEEREKELTPSEKLRKILEPANAEEFVLARGGFAHGNMVEAVSKNPVVLLKVYGTKELVKEDLVGDLSSCEKVKELVNKAIQYPIAAIQAFGATNVVGHFEILFDLKEQRVKNLQKKLLKIDTGCGMKFFNYPTKTVVQLPVGFRIRGLPIWWDNGKVKSWVKENKIFITRIALWEEDRPMFGRIWNVAGILDWEVAQSLGWISGMTLAEMRAFISNPARVLLPLADGTVAADRFKACRICDEFHNYEVDCALNVQLVKSSFPRDPVFNLAFGVKEKGRFTAGSEKPPEASPEPEAAAASSSKTTGGKGKRKVEEAVTEVSANTRDKKKKKVRV